MIIRDGRRIGHGGIDLGPARDELQRKIQEAVAAFNALPPEGQEEILRQQRESWARSCTNHGPRHCVPLKPED